MFLLLLYLALLTITSYRIDGAHTPAPNPAVLDATTRNTVIDGVLRRLQEGYIFPEVAVKMEAAVRVRAAAKEYAALTNGPALARKLTADLQAVSHDLHLAVEYSDAVLPPDPEKPMEPNPAEMEVLRRQMARENYGMERVEILKGNIGYLKINYFVSPEWNGETITAAMNYVANTDALIIDLRDNSGSMSAEAIPFFCGYLFEKPTHINSIYWRPTDKTVDYYSRAEVPGKRYLNKPVYLVTSARTFSGAEEFAYDLKNLKRATLVGDTTGGGANGGGSRRVNDHFSVWVPVARVINPITKTNWEGVGVAPDVRVPAFQALYTAHLTALRKSAQVAADTTWRGNLERLIAEKKKNPPPSRSVTFTLKGYPAARTVYVAGSFNGWAHHANRLTRKGDTWTARIAAEPGRHTYKFIVDGDWIVDPANPKVEGEKPFNNSVVMVK